MILLVFFLFHCTASIYLLHFYFFFFLVFRSAVNEENQDSVMHSDGKRHKDILFIYLLPQIQKCELIIWIGSLLCHCHHWSLQNHSLVLLMCVFRFISMIPSLSSASLTRDKYFNTFNVCVCLFVHILCILLYVCIYLNLHKQYVKTHSALFFTLSIICFTGPTHVAICIFNLLTTV